jgi:hypothetical protein
MAPAAVLGGGTVLAPENDDQAQDTQTDSLPSLPALIEALFVARVKAHAQAAAIAASDEIDTSGEGDGVGVRQGGG